MRTKPTLTTLVAALMLTSGLASIPAVTAQQDELDQAGALALPAPTADAMISACGGDHYTVSELTVTDMDGDGTVCLSLDGSGSSDDAAARKILACRYANGDTSVPLEELEQQNVADHAWRVDGTLLTKKAIHQTTLAADGATRNVSLTVDGYCHGHGTPDAAGFSTASEDTDTQWANIVAAPNPPPTISITSTSCNGLDCTLAVQVADSGDPEEESLTLTTQFGDGNSDVRTTPVKTGPTDLIIPHSYATGGNYAVDLTLEDDDGQATTDSLTLSPESLPPTPMISVGCSGLTCTFTGSASQDPDNDAGTGITSHTWDLGDGTTATGASVTHTYAQDGGYTIELNVTDDEGDWATTSQLLPLDLAPIATFTESCVDLACTFNGSGSYDAGGGTITHAWTLFDGSTSSQDTVDVTFPADGTYNTTLKVIDDEGSEDTQTRQTTVNIPPVATFSASCDTSARTCTFNGSASHDPGLGSITYAWDLGDGNTSTQETLEHTYAEPGGYTVTLTVTDEEETQDTATATIGPFEGSPLAMFTASCSALACSYNASDSHDPDGGPLTYAWTFGDGGTATTVAPTHTYPADGAYQVELAVTDDEGLSTTSNQTLTVNAPPIASATASCTELTCTFNATASEDPGTGPLTFDWALGDGNSSTDALAEHTYATDGSRTATVTVTDDEGTTDSATVTVTPDLAPVASFSVDCVATECTFDGSESHDAGGGPISWAWSLGDGNTSTGSTVTHTYASTGPVSVTLEVTDDESSTASLTKTIEVENSAEPTAVVLEPECAGNRCILYGLASTDDDPANLTYHWDLGDGNETTGGQIVHSYGADGSYTVTLTVEDAQGQTDNDTTTATVDMLVLEDDFETVPLGDHWKPFDGMWRNTTSCQAKPNGVLAFNRDADPRVFSNEIDADEPIGSTVDTAADTAEGTPAEAVIGGPDCTYVLFEESHTEPVNGALENAGGPTPVRTNRPTPTPHDGNATLQLSPDGAPTLEITFDHWGALQDDGSRADPGDEARVQVQDAAGDWHDIPNALWNNQNPLPSTATEVTLHAKIGDLGLALGRDDVHIRFNVTVDGHDDDHEGWFVDNVTVKERNQPPTVAGTFSPATPRDTGADGEETVRLMVTDAVDSDGTVNQFLWREDGEVIAAGTDVNVTLPVGTHAILLEAVDDDGGRAYAHLSIQVLGNVAPIADAGMDVILHDTDRDGTESLTLDGTASHDPDGHLTDYLWSMDGARLTTGATPTVTIPSGVHTLDLTVVDNGGAKGTDTVTVTVNTPPVADAGSDQLVHDVDRSGNEMVTLNGSASADADGTVVDHTWTLGGSTIATGAQPTISLPQGVHEIQLTTTDDRGGTDTATVEVIVNARPVAAASTLAPIHDDDRNGTELVSLDGTSSSDADGAIESYAWTLGGETLATGSTPSVWLPTGEHAVSLTVTDDRGGTDTTTTTVTVNIPPIASAPDVERSDADGSGHETVRLDAAGSTDEDGSVASYTWTEDGTLLGTGQQLDINVNANGATRTIQLEVEDNDGGTNTTLVEVTIHPNHLPSANLTWDCVGVDCTFTSTSTDEDGTIQSTSWSFGDSRTGTGEQLLHEYEEPGTYPVTVTVVDNGGASASKTVQLNVSALLASGFETGTLPDGWISSGANNLWHVDDSCLSPPEGNFSLVFNVGAPGCHYNDGHVRGTVTTTIFNLTGASDPTLSFSHFMQTEENVAWEGIDVRQIHVVNETGERTLVAHWDARDDNPDRWTEHEIDLSPFAGQEILLEFSFDSGDDRFNDFAGWFIDDVLVG